MLLGREISTPPREALKASSHRFVFTHRLVPVLTGSRATHTRELARRTHAPFSATQRQLSVRFNRDKQLRKQGGFDETFRHD